MRCVVQRVFSASVTVGDARVAAISAGALCLVGVVEGDGEEDAEWLATKLLALRLWDVAAEETAAGADAGAAAAAAASPRRWATSVCGPPARELLLVSQFTLAARTRAAKPDFSRAMLGTRAKPLFDGLAARLRARHPAGAGAVAEGVFGAMMRVGMEGDGPVTLLLDSRNREECGGIVPPAAAAAAAAAAGADALA